MNVFEIARQIYFGNTAADKVSGRAFPFSEISFDRGQVDPSSFPEAANLAMRPCRPNGWKYGKAEFPKASELSSPLKRAHALHFFANHELLAMETMAFVILKFPDLDAEFLRGLYRVLRDEQRHFEMYVQRMQALGLEFGSLPLNEYFLSVMESIQCPYDFVVRMNLTFEQANLDFALQYAEIFERFGDTESARILKVVHDDEVRHLAHGVEWFKKWKPAHLEEMSAYANALPEPMTPRRGRGNFYDIEGRKSAGMDDRWIREMKIAGGSRGRRTTDWIPKIFAEMEAARGRALEFSELQEAVQEKVLDLEPLWLWLAQESDCVYFYGDLPSLEFRETVSKYKDLPWCKRINEYKINPDHGLQAWYAGLQIRHLFRKSFWAEMLDRNFEDLAGNINLWISKPDYGTSGRGQKVGSREDLLIPGFAGVVEPFREINYEFSVQCETTGAGQASVLGANRFITGPSRQFLGTWFQAEPTESFLPTGQIERAVSRIAGVLDKQNFSGAFGVDMYSYQQNGQEMFECFSDINPRWTFGRVALELEKIYRRKVGRLVDPVAWMWFTKGDCKRFQVENFSELETLLKKKGVFIVPTTAADSSRGIWTTFLRFPHGIGPKGIMKWIENK